MNIRSSLLVAVVAVAISSKPVAADEPRQPLATTGRPERVTVYTGRALVTRLVDVPTGPATREVLIVDLPEHVVPASLHAECEGCVVRSVSYRARAVEQDLREAVRAIEEQIGATEKSLRENDALAAVLNHRSSHLNQLETFTGARTVDATAKSALDADAVQKLTRFIWEGRDEVVKSSLALSEARREMQTRLELLQRQRADIALGASRTAREAMVALDGAAGGAQLRVRYLADHATWSPTYNARLRDDANAVELEYNGLIQQQTGEDWNDVAITLSTANPALVSRAPDLESLRLGLTRDQAQQPANRVSHLSYFEIQQQTSNDRLASKDPQLDKKLNRVAGQLEVRNLLFDASAAEHAIALGQQSRAESLNVTYALAARTSVPSRADRQLLQIASMKLPVETYKVAAPVLSQFVYNEARAVNDGRLVLLAGPVASYLDDRFVGQSDLPTIAIGESFTIGFGVDATLRARRTLVDRRDGGQGGNRVVNLRHELSIENFGAAACNVRLMDRLPLAKPTEIKLTLASDTPAVSDDPEYRKTRDETGLMRWDVSVPSRQNGPGVFRQPFAFAIEFDRQATLVGLDLTESE